MWTRFMDMHSGGGQKEKWSHIYIESASADDAVKIFYSKFGHNPDRVTCTCCGSDYSMWCEESLDELTEYDRRDMSMEDFMKLDDKKFIPASEVSPSDTEVEVPTQGYVWM